MKLALDAADLAWLQHWLTLALPLHEVLAYGSRVNGSSHDGSDLDLVIRHRLHPETPCPELAALRAQLADSPLPISIDLQDWARLPASFRAEILRSALLLQ
ncbi:nucleotidyltransferase domain-containing protein [Rhodobacteraceae bacterium CH30]|nr:nucleotidyltransferase domain-containing protein [Rhodobacteraceae bacterium CH30]